MGLLAALAVVAGSTLNFSGARKPARLAADDTNAPLFGASVNAGSIAHEESEFGRMAITRVYYPGLPSSNAWTTGLPAQSKSAVIVSFNALPKAILSGQDDAVLSHFFDTAPTGNPIYYSYWHEPEGNIADGEFTLADYKAAWAHVVSLARAAHNPDLHSTLIYGGYTFVPASHRNWRDYLPGGGIISTLGFDAYPPGQVAGKPTLAPPASFMAKQIAAAKSVGLPYGFAEFGVSITVGRPAWLTEVGDYLMHSGALFASLFNGGPHHPSITLADAGSVAAWKGFVAKSGSRTSAPAPASPAPSPTGTAASPAADQPAVSGLALSPQGFAARPQEHTTLTFRLGQASDVTVLVLDKTGTVVRTLARPAQAAGSHAIRYYGFNGSEKRVPAGQYQVVVVASNAHGSGTTQAPLEIDAP